MLRIKSVASTALMVVGLLASQSSAVLIEGWNGSVDSWSTFGGSATLTTSTTTGVTEGSSSLLLSDAALASGGIQSGYTQANAAALNSAGNGDGKFFVDVFVPSTDDLSAGPYFGMFFNGNVVNYGQVGSPNAQALVAGQQTITFTLTADQKAALANPAVLGNYDQVGFFFGNITGPAYFDNFRTSPAPEPTTLAALAGAGLVAFRRRRA